MGYSTFTLESRAHREVKSHLIIIEFYYLRKSNRIRITSLVHLHVADIHSFICSFVRSFIHSFRLILSRLFKSPTTQKRSRHSTNTVSEFHPEAPQATASEGFAQGSYVAARVGLETASLRAKGVESTNEQPRPTFHASSFG